LRAADGIGVKLTGVKRREAVQMLRQHGANMHSKAS
jgi:hypothetical protein